MLRTRKWICAVAICAALLLAAGPVMAVETTVTGTVMETFELETDDGDIYLIEETDMGFDLVAHAGEKMAVTGEVTEDGDLKIISIISFRPVD